MKVQLPYKEIAGKSQISLNDDQIKKILSWYVNLYDMNTTPEQISLIAGAATGRIRAEFNGVVHYTPVEVVGTIQKTQEEKDMPIIDIST